MANFIVDTSVWIEFFKGRLPGPVLDNLVTGLENDQISITDIIAHEILVGASTEGQYDDLNDMLSALPQLRIPDHALAEFNRFAWQVRKKGLGGKYTDIAIAYLSRLYHQPILSFDHYFSKLANTGWIQVIECE